MKEETEGLSRRSFLRGAVVAGVAATTVGLAGCSEGGAPDKGDTSVTWAHEADVVIVGFGGAGGAAAIEALDAGAEVIILDKCPAPGGSTVLCAGIYYGAGTSLQKEAGIDDNADNMYQYLTIMGNGRNVPELTRIQADKSAETFEWIRGMGAEFYPGVNLYGGIPAIKPVDADDTNFGLYYSGAECDPYATKVVPAVPRGHIVRPVEPTWPYPPINPSAPTDVGPSRGTGFFKPLWEGVKERGGSVMLETKAEELLVDDETGEVIGVRAIQPSAPSTDISKVTDYSGGTSINIKARKAVILTAGGHSQNKEFNKIYCREDIYPENYTASDTGDGIIMGMAIGAGTINLDQTLLSCSVTRGAILVNSGGRRFVDETLYGLRPEAWKGQLGWLAWEIGDSVILGTGTAEIKADTIEELAGKIEIDPVALADELVFYNEAVATGIDRQYGKTRSTRAGDSPERAMLPISTPPFYARRKDIESLKTSQGITIGGLRINTDAQVLGVATDEPIPRLYSAGINAGGVMGDMYSGSGSAIAQDLVWGRIAGKNAAAEQPRA
jgi:3-oxo-5alpha-steroid 4-dehydrogenase